MSDATIIISTEQEAKLNWAFSIIYEFMKQSGLDEIDSKLVPLSIIRNEDSD